MKIISSCFGARYSTFTLPDQFFHQLHKNPCHVKKVGQSIAQDIPSDRFITLNEGDQISLMCAYAYAVDFKDVTAAQPPKFRSRTSKQLLITIFPIEVILVTIQF